MGLLSPEFDIGRVAARRVVALHGTLRAGGKPLDVIVIDLSMSGFSAEVDKKLNMGDEVTLGTPSLGTLTAIVIRIQGPLYGFTFKTPITQATVNEARRIDTVRIAAFTGLQGQSAGELPEPFVVKWSPRARVAIIFGLAAGSWLAAIGMASVIRVIVDLV